MVIEKTRGGFFGNGEDYTLGDIEAHLPFICQKSKHFKVLLQYVTIFLTQDRTVRQRIISIESNGRVHFVVYITLCYTKI